MIKLIAIDLDDTLLNEKKEISSENKLALKKAAQNNIKIVIASGRPFFRVYPILELIELNSEDNYVISYNGGYISNCTNTKIIKRELLTKEDIAEITNEIEKYHLDYTIYVDDDIYTLGISSQIKDKLVFRGISFKIINKDDIKKLPYANKIIIADKEEKIKKVVEDIKMHMSSRYNVVKSAQNFLEFLPLRANKGIALKELMNFLKIDKTDVAAIGDEENDLSMMECANYKIAMGNANPILKKQATFITLDQNHSGVAAAIKHLLTNE